MNPIKSFLMPTKGSPIVQNLMQQSLWRQGDEDDQWAQRAVEHLIKKIKKTKGALEALEQAILRHDTHSPCVTIQRSLDGRLQVSHRKGLPHVIYCRVWRWPDLQSHHELRPLPHCRFPFNASSGHHHPPHQHSQLATSKHGLTAEGVDVCINPYHYERVESPVLPPVLVPRRSESAPFMSLLPMSSNASQWNNNTLTLSYQQQQQNAAVAAAMLLNLRHSYYSPIPDQHPLNIDRTHLQPAALAASPSQNSDHYSDLGSPLTNGMLPLRGSRHSGSSTIGDNTPPSPRRRDLGGVVDAMDDDSCAVRYNADDDVIPINYQEAQNWCIIAYYEFNNRVGELFHARRMHVVVDGFTVPLRTTTEIIMTPTTKKLSTDSMKNDETVSVADKIDRFSLGTVLNVTRSLQVEQCRQAIGKGVHLYYVGGEVYAEVLSNSSVFVQSRLANMKNKFHTLTVCKIPPGCSIKIFSNQYFATLLHDKVKAISGPPSASASNVGNETCSSYESIFELNKLCTIRMSLVKGWGADYSRNDITATPCWIEIRLNGPLGWLDRVLSHMPPPPNLISSRS